MPTPHTNRIEAEELARVAEEFRSVAERWHRSSDVSLITGRPTLSVRHRTRAWAYDAAARCCQEKLAASTEDATHE